MEFNKPVSNPMLVGAIELMKAEDTPDHRNMFLNEMMKASFLAPAVIEPTPERDETGKAKLAPGSRVQFPMLTTQDGKRFFMAFTDRMELRKWKDEEDQQTFALKFEDYAAMLLRRDPKGNASPALGFVINPYGGNIVISREMAASLMAARLAQAKNKAGQPINPGGPVNLAQPGAAANFVRPHAGVGADEPGRERDPK